MLHQRFREHEYGQCILSATSLGLEYELSSQRVTNVYLRFHLLAQAPIPQLFTRDGHLLFTRRALPLVGHSF
jgi:hypothetical protein